MFNATSDELQDNFKKKEKKSSKTESNKNKPEGALRGVPGEHPWMGENEFSEQQF